MTPPRRRASNSPSHITKLFDAQAIDESTFLHLLLDNRTIERDDLANQLAIRNTQLNEVLGSTSWRLTKGVRQLSQVLKDEVAPRVITELQRNPRLLPLLDRIRPGIANRLTPAPQPPVNPDADRLEIVNAPYLEWVERFDTDIDVTAIRDYLSALHHQPLISIVMPTFNSPLTYLRESIESVRNQIYANWQLCIVDDASTDPGVTELIAEYVARDPRIVAQYRSTTGNIAAATNDGIAQATGDYVGFLDHDDLLRPHSLAWVVATINEHPDVAVMYSDEDKLTWDGRRFSPYFKPDFDPILLLAQNYMTHFFVARRTELRQVGGQRVGLDGSQDWDLALRLTEIVDESQIRHIPTILYHWRMIEGSTAIRVQLKPAAMTAGRRAVTEAIERRGLPATIEPVSEDAYNLVHFQPVGNPRVAIVIPTRNHADLLSQCLASLEQTDYSNYEIVVINNESDEPATLELLEHIASVPGHRVLDYPHPFNYAAMHNWAIAQLDADYICMLNNDTEALNATWLTDLVGLCQQDHMAAVGALLWYPDETIQHCGVILGINGEAGHRYKLSDKTAIGHGGRILLAGRLSAVTGAAMLVAKPAFDEVGGFDEEFTVSLNDIDLCLALTSAGYHIGYTPAAQLIHYESKSRGLDTDPSKKERYGTEVLRYWQKWAPRIHNDPYHNPNASIEDEGCGAAWPPRVRVPWLASFDYVELPTPRPARYFPLNPILLEPGGTIDFTTRVPPGLIERIDRITIWVLETEPYAIEPHEFWINDGAKVAVVPSWLHLGEITIDIEPIKVAGSLTLGHDGQTPVLIEAVTVAKQASLRIKVAQRIPPDPPLYDEHLNL